MPSQNITVSPLYFGTDLGARNLGSLSGALKTHFGVEGTTQGGQFCFFGYSGIRWCLLLYKRRARISFPIVLMKRIHFGFQKLAIWVRIGICWISPINLAHKTVLHISSNFLTNSSWSIRKRNPILNTLCWYFKSHFVSHLSLLLHLSVACLVQSNFSTGKKLFKRYRQMRLIVFYRHVFVEQKHLPLINVPSFQKIMISTEYRTIPYKFDKWHISEKWIKQIDFMQLCVRHCCVEKQQNFHFQLYFYC